MNTIELEKKIKLIEALEEERSRFERRGQDTEEHDVAIDYLRNGVLPKWNVSRYELLDAVINDFETLCSDYVVL